MQTEIFLVQISFRDDLYRFDFGAGEIVYADFVEAVRLLQELKRLRSPKPLISPANLPHD